MNTTVAIILCAVIGFAVSALLGIVLVPWLHKLKFGQTILDIGPSWHKKKQGTPTMGGIMFIAATIVALLVVALTDYFLGGNLVQGADLSGMNAHTKLWGGLLMAIGFAAIGFADDYIKVVKKRNLGLTEKQKTVMQLLVAVAYLASLHIAEGTHTYIPFLGDIPLHPVVYYAFGIIVIYAATNAVNFTDGIDGLCGSVTMLAALSFTIMGILRQMMGVSIMGAALAGACGGYLIWNWYPGKVMMGDTGSMFLGGMVVALAYSLNWPIILVPVGIIYVIEGGSVVIQRAYFKITKHKTGTGKRIFKMTPIHHGLEMSGWKETKIVFVFSGITILGGALGVLLMYFG